MRRIPVDIGNPGAETLSVQVTEAGDMALAGNLTNGGTTLRITGQCTISAYNDPGNVGDFCADDTYLYYHGATRWYRVAWDNTQW